MAEQWEGEHGYAPKNHNHDSNYSKLGHTHDGIGELPAHNHDERYYTEAEVDAKLKALKDEVLVAGIDMLPVGTIMWFKQSVTLSNKWQVYEPLIGRYPLGATSGLGSTVEAGLPNITGHVSPSVHVDDTNFSGAMYREETTGKRVTTDNQVTPRYAIMFDASRSNSTYGKSTTVTPPSAKLIPYVKIA